jgi:GDPmannose 4,6-dehydratase
MAKKALITGITGQDGSYLAELLLEKGYDVHGVVRRASTFNRERIDHLYSDIPDSNIHTELHYGDLGDSNSLLRILAKVRPDEIYNLAAQSHVGISFDIPEYTGDVTGMGVVRFLELIRSLDLDTRFYQASSSELYGKVLENPQTETTQFYPRSPYACAKAYAFHITRNYRESYDIFACNGILFNHESPRRGKNFVTRKITYSLAAIQAGKQDVLHLGNLDARRDWGYAPEYTEGMWRMLQQDTPDDYVLATGTTVSVREFLEYCLEHIGMDFKREGEGVDEKYIDNQTGKTIVAVHPRYYRPTEVDELCGDPSKAKAKLGWEAKTDVKGLAEIMLQADLELLNIATSAK